MVLEKDSDTSHRIASHRDIAKVYHFTRKVFDAFMGSTTDPCYECQMTLTENSQLKRPKTEQQAHEIQLRVAISK